MKHMRSVSYGLKGREGLSAERRAGWSLGPGLAQNTAKIDFRNDLASAWATFVNDKKTEVAV